ncbi:hypothetical protein TNCV_178811 [Trichonephila clavipes]|nr:hypothetical protein TNCV_178811 [Trichonephila clavipes]
MAWRNIRKLESGQTQRTIADAVGLARLLNGFQETQGLRPGQDEVSDKNCQVVDDVCQEGSLLLSASGM